MYEEQRFLEFMVLEVGKSRYQGGGTWCEGFHSNVAEGIMYGVRESILLEQNHSCQSLFIARCNATCLKSQHS